MKSNSTPSPRGLSKNKSKSSSIIISSTEPAAWLWERRDENGKLIDHKIWLQKPSLDLEVWNATLTPLYLGEPIRPTTKVNDSTKFVYGL